MSGWIKTGSKGCVCWSLSVTPGILHPRALTRWGEPLSPGAIHPPVICPPRGPPSRILQPPWGCGPGIPAACGPICSPLRLPTVGRLQSSDQG